MGFLLRYPTFNVPMPELIMPFFVAPSPLRNYSPQVTQLPTHIREYHYYSIILSQDELNSQCEASTNPLWQQVMVNELQALTKTHTWDLVDLPLARLWLGVNDSTKLDSV